MHLIGFLIIPLFLIIGAVQIGFGYIGIEDWLGTGWAIGAVILAFGLRIMLPVTIGSYLAIVNVFGYPWWVGVLVAAPGLMFILPSMVMSILEPIFAKRQ